MALKHKFLGATLAALMFTGGVANAEQVIRFGSDATYPPFEYTSPSGEILGFDIDLAKAMCEKMKAKCTFQNQAWDGIIPALRAKKFDVIASSMSITPERKRAVAFTQKIWSTPNPFIGKIGTDADTTADKTQGIEIGVQQGTIQDKYATKYFVGAKIKRYKTFEDALNDLVTGRTQVVFCDNGVADEFLKGPNGKGYGIIGKPLPSTADLEIFGEGTGFAVRKEDTKLLEQLNKAFNEIRADGTYDKISKQYFEYSVYD